MKARLRAPRGGVRRERTRGSGRGIGAVRAARATAPGPFPGVRGRAFGMSVKKEGLGGGAEGLGGFCLPRVAYCRVSVGVAWARRRELKKKARSARLPRLWLGGRGEEIRYAPLSEHLAGEFAGSERGEAGEGGGARGGCRHGRTVSGCAGEDIRDVREEGRGWAAERRDWGVSVSPVLPIAEPLLALRGPGGPRPVARASATGSGSRM